MDGTCRRPAVQLRREVAALLARRLGQLHPDRVRPRVAVLADAGHLPGDLRARLRADDEAVAADLLPDAGTRIPRLPSDRGELVAEVAVQGAEVAGQAHGREAAPVVRTTPS